MRARADAFTCRAAAAQRARVRAHRRALRSAGRAAMATTTTDARTRRRVSRASVHRAQRSTHRGILGRDQRVCGERPAAQVAPRAREQIDTYTRHLQRSARTHFLRKRVKSPRSRAPNDVAGRRAAARRRCCRCRSRRHRHYWHRASW